MRHCWGVPSAAWLNLRMPRFATLPPEEQWRKVLIEGHQPINFGRSLFARLPSPPRCKMCNNPFAGPGGRLFRMWGRGPSRKNPNICASCCEDLPPGGAEVDIAIVFADVRGSTRLGEDTDPAAFAKLMNRFYKAATAALLKHDAIIDKIIGDEVMGLFIPGIAGPEYRRRSLDAAVDLLRAVGYGSRAGPWMSIGMGVNAGVSFVGNVGEGVVDFTALGDPVNVAARLQSKAASGEILVAEDLVPDIAARFPQAERRTLKLRGHRAPVVAFAVRP